MRWVLMLFVILAAVMGGEARAVVVSGRVVVSERDGKAEEKAAEALRVESERAFLGAALEVQKAAGFVDAGPLALWFPGGFAVARSDCGDRQAEFSGGTLSLLLARGVDIGGGTRGLLWTARRETVSAETGSTVTLRFNRYNSRGDVVGQSDAAGVTKWAATYQADGRRTGEIGTNLNPKHATGRVRELGVNRDRHRANSKEEDPTGLLNEGFRYRDMETGTFISRDPLGHVDGPNVYCYVRQNPWSKFDPEGLSEEEIQAINRAVDAKVAELGFIGKVASWAGADKALKSSLGTANERMNASSAAGNGRTLSTGEYIGGIAEGAAPAATIAVMAPAAAAGPAVLAKEAIGEATGLPIGVDDLVKVAKNAPDIVKSAKKLAQGADEAAGAVNRALGGGPIRLSEGGTGRAFAGHGVEEGFEGGFGSLVVPQGTSIMIPGSKGLRMPDGLGRAIEADNWDAIRLNPQWAKLMEGSRTFLPGEEVPNLMLTRGGGLHMLQNSTRVRSPTLLSELLKPGMGRFNWAACRQCF
jgi:RHS repeat-associated protein